MLSFYNKCIYGIIFQEVGVKPFYSRSEAIRAAYEKKRTLGSV